MHSAMTVNKQLLNRKQMYHALECHSVTLISSYTLLFHHYLRSFQMIIPLFHSLPPSPLLKGGKLILITSLEGGEDLKIKKRGWKHSVGAGLYKKGVEQKRGEEEQKF